MTETITDASGQVTCAKDKGSGSTYRTTSFLFDEGGRPTKMTRPEGNQTTWVYDKLGRVTQETRQIDRNTTTATTTTTWSAGGRRLKVKDANNVETWWTYNSFGQELTVVYNAASTPTRTYTKTYDSAGRLYTETSPEGAVLTRTYDDCDRTTQIDIAMNSSGFIGPDRVVFAFDDLSRVTSGKTQDESGGSYTDLTSVSRSYNGFGELSSETQNVGFAFSLSYAANGALDEITYPAGGPVLGARYVLDDNGRIDSVDRKLNTTVEGIGSVAWDTGCATLEYEGRREIQRVQDAYDLDRTQTWTAYKEPAVLRYEKDSTNALLTGLDCDWDDNGRMLARARLHDTVGSDQYGELFQYDDMDCLTHMWTDLKNPGDYLGYSVPESTAVFDEQVFYDMGKVYERKDRKVNPDDGESTWTTHPITNNNFYQYTAVDGQSQSYDDDGQLTDNGPWAFRWTALGQLAEADPDSGTTLENEFDAFGRRVTRTAGSQVSRYVYLGWHMIGEYDDAADEWLWQEVPMSEGEGMLEHIALDTNDLDDDQNTTEYRQYAVQADFQVTVWGLSDAAGAQVEQYLYSDPYGVSSTEDASGAGIGDYATEVYHQKRLHGGVVDVETQLYDFRNRWYAASTGSWHSKDPLGVDSHGTMYEALLARPLTTVDPLGMRSIAGGGGNQFPPVPEGRGWPLCGKCPRDDDKECPCCNTWRAMVDGMRIDYLKNYGSAASDPYVLRAQQRIFGILSGMSLDCAEWGAKPHGCHPSLCAGYDFDLTPSAITICVDATCSNNRRWCTLMTCTGMIEHEVGHALCYRSQIAMGVPHALAKKNCSHLNDDESENLPYGGDPGDCGELYWDLFSDPLNGRDTLAALGEKCGFML